jgi:hypothetical protein
LKKIELINEITDFCLKYRLFNGVIRIDEIKNNIESRLNDSRFIESLINVIILKTRNRQNININKIKNMLLELEKIRLDLEYNGKNKEVKNVCN